MLPTEPVPPIDTAEESAVPRSPSFRIEDLTTGAHSHGFGEAYGRTFAFRVRKSLLYVEIYREYCERSVPTPADVLATAQRSVTEIDLTDERSVAAVVRDAVLSTEVEASGADRDGARLDDDQHVTTVRAALNRLSSIIDSVR